jgi:hypothetical protein
MKRLMEQLVYGFRRCVFQNSLKKKAKQKIGDILYRSPDTFDDTCCFDRVTIAADVPQTV